jgi:hypothetical protein
MTSEQIMTSKQSRHCRHIGEDGTQCKAYRQGYSEYCFFHDPLLKEERAVASRDGGAMRGQKAQGALRLPADMFTESLNTAANLEKLMKMTLEKMCRGEIDMRAGTTVAYMVSILQQTMDSADAEAAELAGAASSQPE